MSEMNKKLVTSLLLLLIIIIAGIGVRNYVNAQIGFPPAPNLHIRSLAVGGSSAPFARDIIVVVENTTPITGAGKLSPQNMMAQILPPPTPSSSSTPSTLIITTNTDIQTGSTQIYRIPPLAAGQTYTVRRTVYPTDYAAYSTKITAVVDPLGEVSESNESDNISVLYLSSTVVPPAPKPLLNSY